jgi:hypothetical protein
MEPRVFRPGARATSASFPARFSCFSACSRLRAADLDTQASTYATATGLRPAVYLAPRPSLCARALASTFVVEPA